MSRLAITICALMGVAASRADAQTAGNIPLDAFHPAMDSRGYITVDASQVLDDREISFGLGGLDWAHHVLELGPTSYSVNELLTATLVGAFGVRIGPMPLELGLSLPFLVMDGGHAGDSISGQGVGNLELHAKARLLDSRHALLGLGVIGTVSVPTQSGLFLGTPKRAVVPEATAIVDTQLGSRLRLAVNGGIRLRSADTVTSDPMAMSTTLTAGSELPFGAGLGYTVVADKLELVGEVYGSVPLGAHQNYQPLEALAGIKLYLAKSSFLSLGAGRGMVASPDVRAFIGIVFEPALADHVESHAADDVVAPPPDEDRVVERAPDCANPETPEDQCPDRDSDGDGIVDKDDLCPFEPGPASEAGCPETTRVVTTETKLVVLRPINFEFDKAIIKRDSYQILDDVVAAIQANPDIKRLEIQGHTDERGDDDYNLDLSTRRAAAVVTYLTSHGVSASRLSSQGYGKTQPIDRHHDDAAWTKNRRVEFVILERTDR